MSGGTVPMGPEVGVGVNDRTVGDIENLAHGDGEEREGSELEVFLEIVVGAPAYQGRAPFEASEALKSRCPVTFGVAPFFLPVEMIVCDHSLPKCGDFVVCQADVATSDGTAGKSADKEVVQIPTEFLADAGQVDLAIVNGGLPVAPPSHGVLFFSFLNIGHGDPDESFPSAQAIAQVGTLDFAG